MEVSQAKGRPEGVIHADWGDTGPLWRLLDLKNIPRSLARETYKPLARTYSGQVWLYVVMFNWIGEIITIL